MLSNKKILMITIVFVAAALLLPVVYAGDCKFAVACYISGDKKCGDCGTSWKKLDDCSYHADLADVCQRECKCDTSCFSCTDAQETKTCDAYNNWPADNSRCVSYVVAYDGPKTVGCIATRVDAGQAPAHSNVNCCKPGISYVTNGVCCTESSCSNAVCDADSDGNKCGNYSCAPGWKSLRMESAASHDTTSADYEKGGSCKCINDNPSKFFDTSTMTSRTPSGSDKGGFDVLPPYVVRWYTLLMKVTGLDSDTSATFAFCEKDSCNSGTFSLFSPVIHSGGYPNFTLYSTTSTLAPVVSNKLTFMINLSTSVNTKTPSVISITARSFPRLYNSNNNIVQGPGRAACWPTEELVKCELNDPAHIIGLKTCSIDINKTTVSAMLNGDGYTENNLYDNVGIARNDSWCYAPPDSPYRHDDTNAVCTDNSKCAFRCCAKASDMAPTGNCKIPTYFVDADSGKEYGVSSDDTTKYCGVSPGGKPCASDLQCSTQCCDKTGDTCIYPDESGSNCRMA